MKDLSVNNNLWVLSAQRLKEELVFVKKQVRGCSSIMFSTDNKSFRMLVGKIDGVKFEIDIKVDPNTLNHSDFEDIIDVLNRKKERDNGSV